MAKEVFTKEQSDWIIKNRPRYKKGEGGLLAEDFNDEFNTDFNQRQLLNHYLHKKEGKERKPQYLWTEEMKEWFINNYPLYINPELTILFNERFNMNFTSYSLESVKLRKFPYLEKSKETQLKWCSNGGSKNWEKNREKLTNCFKGRTGGPAIGHMSTTRKRKTKFLTIKVEYGHGQKHKGYMLYHRYMYEKYHNVKLTTDDFVVPLDGNYENVSEDNLILLDKETTSTFNQTLRWNPELKNTPAMNTLRKTVELQTLINKLEKEEEENE